MSSYNYKVGQRVMFRGNERYITQLPDEDNLGCFGLTNDLRSIAYILQYTNNAEELSPLYKPGDQVVVLDYKRLLSRLARDRDWVREIAGKVTTIGQDGMPEKIDGWHVNLSWIEWHAGVEEKSVSSYNYKVGQPVWYNKEKFVIIHILGNEKVLLENDYRHIPSCFADITPAFEKGDRVKVTATREHLKKLNIVGDVSDIVFYVAGVLNGSCTQYLQLTPAISNGDYTPEYNFAIPPKFCEWVNPYDKEGSVYKPGMKVRVCGKERLLEHVGHAHTGLESWLAAAGTVRTLKAKFGSCSWTFEESPHRLVYHENLFTPVEDTPDENDVTKIKILSDYGAELKDEFEAKHGDGGCSCHVNPPCSYCTHPGNPLALEETPEAWCFIDAGSLRYQPNSDSFLLHVSGTPVQDTRELIPEWFRDKEKDRAALHDVLGYKPYVQAQYHCMRWNPELQTGCTYTGSQSEVRAHMQKEHNGESVPVFSSGVWNLYKV